MIQGFEFKKDEEKIQELAKKVADRAKEILEGNDVTVDDLKRVASAIHLLTAEPDYAPSTRILLVITELSELIGCNNCGMGTDDFDALVEARDILMGIV